MTQPLSVSSGFFPDPRRVQSFDIEALLDGYEPFTKLLPVNPNGPGAALIALAELCNDAVYEEARNLGSVDAAEVQVAPQKFRMRVAAEVYVSWAVPAPWNWVMFTQHTVGSPHVASRHPIDWMRLDERYEFMEAFDMEPELRTFDDNLSNKRPHVRFHARCTCQYGLAVHPVQWCVHRVIAAELAAGLFTVNTTAGDLWSQQGASLPSEEAQQLRQFRTPPLPTRWTDVVTDAPWPRR